MTLIFLLLIFLCFGALSGLNFISLVKLDFPTMIVVSIVVAGLVASIFDGRD